MRIGVVACSKAKLDRAAPARELYTSPLFKAASEYAKATYDRWLILSAKHGLVEPDTVLEPYDVTLRGMNAEEREAWADDVLGTLEAVTTGEVSLYVHAGDLYRGWVPYWKFGPVKVPLAGLGIGQQLAWYAARRAARGGR